MSKNYDELMAIIAEEDRLKGRLQSGGLSGDTFVKFICSKLDKLEELVAGGGSNPPFHRS